MSTLTRAAELLIDKHIAAGELSISTHPSKERRYRITDSYLRFWFAFLGPHLTEIDRMRSDLTLDRIRQGWTSSRGGRSSLSFVNRRHECSRRTAFPQCPRWAPTGPAATMSRSSCRPTPPNFFDEDRALRL